MTPSSSNPTEGDGPSVAVSLASRAPTPDPAVWDMAWSVRNRGSTPLRVLSAWLPHGRFRSPRHNIEPALTIAPAEQARLEFAVQCQEAAGTVVENCFVILNVDWSGAEWQVFARVTVTFGPEGVPEPETVLITAQRTGFSA